MYIRESQAYRERASMANSPLSSRIRAGKKRREEELYLYEPLKYHDDEQQQIMRTIINEWLRMLLSSPEQREQLLQRKRRDPVAEAEAEAEKKRKAAADAAERAERKAERERKEQARLERERLQTMAGKEVETVGGGKMLPQAVHEEDEYEDGEPELIIPPETEEGLRKAAEERELLLKQIEDEKKRALAAEAERERLKKLRDKRQAEVDELRKKIQALQDQIAKLKESLASTGKVADVDLSLFGAAPEVVDPEPTIPVKAAPKPKPEPKALPQRGKVTKVVKQANIDHAALQRLVDEAVEAARRRCETEKATFLARIKELEDEIKRLRALLRAPKTTPKPKVVQKTMRKVYKEPEKIATSQPRRYSTRRIFARLHQDAAHRVTRMICRREQSDAEKAGDIRRSVVHSDAIEENELYGHQLEQAALQLERYGPEARRKESLRLRDLTLSYSEGALGASREVSTAGRPTTECWFDAEHEPCPGENLPGPVVEWLQLRRPFEPEAETPLKQHLAALAKQWQSRTQSSHDELEAEKAADREPDPDSVLRVSSLS